MIQVLRSNAAGCQLVKIGESTFVIRKPKGDGSFKVFHSGRSFKRAEAKWDWKICDCSVFQMSSAKQREIAFFI